MQQLLVVWGNMLTFLVLHVLLHSTQWKAVDSSVQCTGVDYLLKNLTILHASCTCPRSKMVYVKSCLEGSVKIDR